MRKLIILFFLSISTFATYAQSCCETVFASNDGNMARFVNDPSFLAAHLTPIEYKHTSSVGGSMIQFDTPDGQKANGYLVKATKKNSNKWLFVYQEWWGLNDNIKRQSDVFYQDLGGEVNVLALDMYDGKLATTAQEAGKYMQGVNEARLENIVKGGMALAGKKAKIASVGWCFGGSWSLKSAILEGKQAVGCVMYYGMPVRDKEKLKLLKTDVLGLFSTEQYISKEIIEEFATNMKSLGKTLTYKIFEAAHAFANPSNPKYDEAKAKEAYGMAINYLKQRLKVKYP